ncbi:alanine racemase [Lysinibacter cavernae]|uniref:alanine racemase n=1 Tax=Lysinibacter cavernae TaxID=1640652 RepID=UPI00361617BF
MTSEVLEQRPFRRAVVSTSAIAENVRSLRARFAGQTVIAVVKANAYGHGAVASARAALAGGATWLGVADLNEAIELRSAGIDSSLLCWVHGPNTAFEYGIAKNIDIGVSSLAQLEAVAAAVARLRLGNEAGPVTAMIQIKCDSGLSRNGVPSDQITSVFSRARELERAGVLRVRGLFSHLSNASEADDREAIAAFAGIVKMATDAGLEPDLIHIAASAAALSYSAEDLVVLPVNAVRLGLVIYGLSPLEGVTSADLGLRPAMCLEGTVLNVKRVPAGAGVSYDYTYRTAGETTLALVGLGYADGIPRAASNSAQISVRGRTYRIAGRVAMDQFVLDVGDDTVDVGDTAVIFGDPNDGYPSVESFAEACGTINYEIVTRVGPRAYREYTTE